MLKMLHVTDSHASNLLTSFQNIASNFGCDLNVHTGDIVQDYFEQGVGAFSNRVFAPIIGNHDAILQAGTDPSGYHWNQQPTLTQLYNRYFANGVVTPEANTCWWIKEFTDEKVLVIGLDNALYASATIDVELSWLNEKLDYAIENDLAVAIFQHGLLKSYSIVDCVFTAPSRKTTFVGETTGWHDAYPYIYKLDAVLKAFKGKLIGIFAGHTHYDIFATFTKDDGTKVPYIMAGSMLADAYNDVSRSGTNTINGVVANRYEYTGNSLRIYRIGASGCKTGVRRKMMVWDYGTQSIVSSCSASEH